MRALVATGVREEMALQDIPQAEFGPAHVLVEVRAISSIGARFTGSRLPGQGGIRGGTSLSQVVLKGRTTNLKGRTTNEITNEIESTPAIC
jgi:hypothetical protein